MKTIKSTLPTLVMAGFVLAGCPGDDTTPGDGSTTDDTTSTSSPTSSPTSTPEDTTATDTSATNTTMEDTTSTSTTADDPFVFDDTAPEDYVQVDRQGFPAVNTGLNLLGDKDEYNAASPADDASLSFVSNILDSLNTLHLGAPGMQTADNTGLDDDLLALGLEPCVAPQLPMDSCDDQGAPFVIPDVIEISLDGPDDLRTMLEEPSDEPEPRPRDER